ncbi:hypothetical protein L208DRAFT_1561143 [Tricholoma matsutake]|nr:hypothetical protein L208DRAFT_1561143 [Tricholoma matsutake 945]
MAVRFNALRVDATNLVLVSIILWQHFLMIVKTIYHKTVSIIARCQINAGTQTSMLGPLLLAIHNNIWKIFNMSSQVEPKPFLKNVSLILELLVQLFVLVCNLIPHIHLLSSSLLT